MPIIVHAEGQRIASVLCLAQMYSRSVHIAYVSRREEILFIRAAKVNGLRVTCGVTPHHLFLHRDNIQFILNTYDANDYGFRFVKPELQTANDCQALWDNLDVIDCIASDHVPYTQDEKSNVKNPLPGFPGLQTLLPLMLNAVNDGKLTMEQLIEKVYTNPKRIFNLPDQGDNTFVEVDMSRKWIVNDKLLFSKAGWTPFIGMSLRGIVYRVILHGEVVFANGQVLAEPGSGKNIIDLRKEPTRIIKTETPLLLKTEHSPIQAQKPCRRRK